MSNTGQPPEKPTAAIPAAEIMNARLQQIIDGQKAQAQATEIGFKEVKADFDLLGGQFESLKVDVQGLQSWRVRTEDKLARNSDRAKSLSDSDLSLQAKQAEEIIKNAEQDKAIAETRELASIAVAKLTDIATAADARSKVLTDLATTVGTALKSKMAERIALTAGGAILAIIGYYAKKYGVPQ